MDCFKISKAVIRDSSDFLKCKLSIKTTAEIICVQNSRVLY